MSPQSFIALAERYLSERRALGHTPADSGERLLAFARFVEERAPGGPLTLSLALEWARASKSTDPVHCARRLAIVRPFARYLRQFHPATEVPPARILGPANRRGHPHVFTQEELLALLGQARRLSPLGGLRPVAIATVLGLLACTGIRVSEALKLRRDDVDLDEGLLYVRESKFHKSRLVPLHPSAVRELRRYASLRDRLAGNPASDAFFLVDGGIVLDYSKMCTAFLRLRIWLGWPRRFERCPRVHDLRHTFACRRLLRWYEESVDVEARLLDLCTYLGHAKVTHTYWYLSGFPELMDLTGRRFEHFASPREEVRP